MTHACIGAEKGRVLGVAGELIGECSFSALLPATLRPAEFVVLLGLLVEILSGLIKEDEMLL